MKLSSLFESDLNSKSVEELEQMLVAAKKRLKAAAEDSPEEMKAEKLAHDIEDEIYKRANK